MQIESIDCCFYLPKIIVKETQNKKKITLCSK